MRRRRERVQFRLDPGDVKDLPECEIAAILRGADDLIMQGASIRKRVGFHHVYQSGALPVVFPPFQFVPAPTVLTPERPRCASAAPVNADPPNPPDGAQFATDFPFSVSTPPCDGHSEAGRAAGSENGRTTGCCVEEPSLMRSHRPVSDRRRMGEHSRGQRPSDT